MLLRLRAALAPRHLIAPLGHHLLVLWLLLSLLISSCSGLVETPREATEIARAGLTPSPSITPLLSTAPTPTGTPPSPTATPLTEASNPTITLWVPEKSAEHRATLERMAEMFNAQYGIHLEWMQVTPDQLPTLVNTAVISGTLPDLIFHPMEYTMGWHAEGILDGAAAAEALERLDPSTFDPTALALVRDGGSPVALPSDGYKQLIIYRTDWFAERDLPPPDRFETMLNAAATLYFTPTLTAGFVVPTESDLVTTQYVFEQLATANGCRLVDDKGEVLLLHPACLEALDFYQQIINQYSPSDVQTNISTLNAYLSGRAGLIMATPSILPQLAGLDPAFRPSCPDCTSPDFLARQSNILTELGGGNGQFATTASFGTINYLGITTAADTDLAVQFAEFWFETGYLEWLATDSARKVPQRLGTPAEPGRFIDSWGHLPLVPDGPSLSDIYGPDVVATLSTDVATPDRWGFGSGQGPLITRLVEELTFPILLQEMLSGYFSSSQTIIEAYNRVTRLIPNYAYYPTPEPTATSEP